MAICSATSYPFGFPSRSKRPPLYILKFLGTTLRNQDKKVAFIRVDEDGSLARSSKFMRTCHNMNIIVQTTGGDSSSLNGKSESPNKTLANIKRALLINSSHKKNTDFTIAHWHTNFSNHLNGLQVEASGGLEIVSTLHHLSKCTYGGAILLPTCNKCFKWYLPQPKATGYRVVSIGYFIILGPSQDVPYALILWYVLTHLFIVGIGPILNKELEFIYRSDRSDCTCVYS